MRFFLVLTAFLSLKAHAATQVIFARDGSKVSILMMAMGANPDASRLYEALNVAPEEMNGKLTKRIAFTDADGVKAFDIVCAFSKVAPTGSCVSVLHRAREVVMDPSAHAASYQVHGEEARRLAGLFLISSGASTVYESSDHHFTLKVSPSSGTVDDFFVEYR